MLRKDDVQNMYIFKKAHTKLQTISSQFPEVAALCSSLVSCLCLFIDKCQKAITLQSTVQTGTLWTGEKVSTNNMIILMMTFANMEKILLIVKLK